MNIDAGAYQRGQRAAGHFAVGVRFGRTYQRDADHDTEAAAEQIRFRCRYRRRTEG